MAYKLAAAMLACDEGAWPAKLKEKVQAARQKAAATSSQLVAKLSEATRTARAAALVVAATSLLPEGEDGGLSR